MAMGAHTAVNGHRGEDGAATVPPFQPLDLTWFVPVTRGPVSDLPQPAGPGWWQRRRESVRAHSTTYQACLAAVPVVLVNVVAFGAQLGFWGAHLGVLAQAVLVALALESIAIYLAWQAHLAQLADDSALRLRLAAYGIALLIGALNYSHFDGPGWRPTVPAVTFGMMSAISPWLWSVHSRRQSRDALKARGLIEPHAVRLGGTRWTWHPFRSIRVMSRATWTGETDPSAAIATWKPRKARKPASQATPVAAPAVTLKSPVQVTLEPVSGDSASQPGSPAPAVTQVRQSRKAQVKPARVSDDDLKAEIRSALAAGTAPSVNAVAKKLGRGRDRVRPLLEQVRSEVAEPEGLGGERGEE